MSFAFLIYSNRAPDALGRSHIAETLAFDCFFLPSSFFRLPSSFGQVSTVNSQLSTVNFQLSTVNSQLSTLNSQLSTVNCQLLYQAQLAERYGDAIYLDTKPQNN
ncbi:hypothetical protein QUB63_13940 [Microcoleus sp. ARI1-B5]|uniref:hypothetical protein n=1 Tax=unclassified Microcoleus TaxID=2642155 RepID=UPI002FCEB170